MKCWRSFNVLVVKVQVTKEEIAEAMAWFTTCREPDDMPTEKEVEEMIIRMKLRWGNYG